MYIKPTKTEKIEALIKLRQISNLSQKFVHLWIRLRINGGSKHWAKEIFHNSLKIFVISSVTINVTKRKNRKIKTIQSNPIQFYSNNLIFVNNFLRFDVLHGDVI